jgi:hypothetical protein
MCRNAMLDGGVVAIKESSNLGVAVLAIWMVADLPPQLLACSADAERAASTTDLLRQNAAPVAHLGQQLGQMASLEQIQDPACN